MMRLIYGEAGPITKSYAGPAAVRSAGRCGRAAAGFARRWEATGGTSICAVTRPESAVSWLRQARGFLPAGEVGAGATPGAGGVQHLGRLLGRGRAMEAILGADDFGAEQAERYGWINRALPDAELDAFVARLARRIASFPADAVRSAKRVLNELTLPGADAIRADARRFRQLVASDPAQARTAALFAQGLQTRGPLELDLGDRIGAL